MMLAIRQWLLGVVLTSFAVGLAVQIAPKGREQSLIRLVGGVLLLLAIFRPLTTPSTGTAIPAWGSLFAVDTTQYEETYQQSLSAIIAERTEAYIWDKATLLGISGTITVTTAVGESGIPLPRQVTIAASYHQELSAWIEQEVGISAQNQVWLEGMS